METAVNTSAFPEISPGLPVEIGRIDKELGKLWETSDDTKTRASLINLVIYTESAAQVAANTELISRIASQHACRAILIFANPSAAGAHASAWISAHCHNVGKGARQICSEQITFQLDGETASAVPNVVFSHLDSDLPLCFWWQGELSAEPDENLWSWVDRLIFDSQTWSDPAEQFARACAISHLSRARTILCDLNWTRLLTARFALANVFDHAAALPALRDVKKLTITHTKQARTTAILLAGWLAAQLGWTLESVLGRHAFRDKRNAEVGFELIEADGACISTVEFQSASAIITLRREPKAEFFHASIRPVSGGEVTQMLPAGRDSLREHLLMELSRGGVHPLYAKALDLIRPVFSHD
jgi:glucose-6-phosphate dehydrogenase assembly protein OpcA